MKQPTIWSAKVRQGHSFEFFLRYHKITNQKVSQRLDTQVISPGNCGNYLLGSTQAKEFLQQQRPKFTRDVQRKGRKTLKMIVDLPTRHCKLRRHIHNIGLTEDAAKRRKKLKFMYCARQGQVLQYWVSRTAQHINTLRSQSHRRYALTDDTPHKEACHAGKVREPLLGLRRSIIEQERSFINCVLMLYQVAMDNFFCSIRNNI